MFIKKENYNTIGSVVEGNTGMSVLTFLTESHKPHMDMLQETADAIKNYLKSVSNPNVIIVGDYDADGDTSTAIMFWMFKALGVNPKFRIPKRFSEGYGMSEKIVEEFPNCPNKDGLVITVDNGIAAFKAIEKAKAKGYTVIVTDHHLPPKDADGNMILPPADIILDPHIYPEKSEFEDYCGAGIAYRLAEVLLPNMNLIQLKVLASIGTVADVMPLVGANRTLVKEGLEAINNRKCVPGLNAIINALKLSNHITADDYGFMLGPVFNASGRLYDDGASRVVNVLTSGNSPELINKAENLVQINNIRKALVRESMEAAEKALSADVIKNRKPIVLYDETIGEGIIGIIAGHLTEKYYCPSVVFTKTENPDILKGSGRSIPEIHLKDALDKIQDKIVGYGGHAGAAGLSIKKDDLKEFTKALADACGKLPDKTEDIYYDLELGDNYKGIMDELNIYAPYGEGNPKPVFHKTFDVADGEYREIGDKTHFMIKCNGVTLMGFGLTNKYKEAGFPKKIECVGYLSENWFNNSVSYNFEILDFIPV